MGMPHAIFDLKRLIHPIDPQTFIRDYWEKRPLLVRRRDRDYYRPLLSLADVDGLLSNSSIHPPEIRVVRGGEEVRLGSPEAGGMIGRARMLESLYWEYRRGATIVLQFLHERWQPLAQLCQTLTTAFSASFQTNAYLTPAKERAIGTHYDTHDVFVLQTEGSKHWRIYESDQSRLPLEGQPYREETKPGRLMKEFDLRAGDVAYIPRGWMHDAVSQGAASLHLTVGVTTITWASVILRTVESAIERDTSFRESLPPGFARNSALRTATEARLTELFARLVRQVDAGTVIDDAVQQAEGLEHAVLGGHLLDLEALSRVSLHTKVSRRPDLRSTLVVKGKHASLSFHSKTLQMPSYTGRDLRFIVAAGTFTAADLPGGLDGKGRLVLVRELIREGFLTISDRPPPSILGS